MKTKDVAKGKVYAEIYIDAVSDLSGIPEELKKSLCAGSVAYSLSPIALYHWTENGWADKNGAVVST
jgi:hypothetical protein